MSKFSQALKATVFVGAALAIGATDALAQIEEIVVTTRKREENLQSVPIVVTAFTSDRLERSNIKNFSDIALMTPALTVDKGFVPQDIRPNIRGLSTTRGRPSVGILVDGIDISSENLSTSGGSNLANLRLVDVERVEVVKGPQSALYGRVAFGGAISYVSKAPQFDAFEGNASIDAGSYGMLEGKVSVSGPVNDKLAMRANAAYYKYDGSFRNKVSGAKLGGINMGGGSVAATFKPSDTADITLRAMYYEDHQDPRPQYYLGGANGAVTAYPLPIDVGNYAIGGVLAPGGGSFIVPPSVPVCTPTTCLSPTFGKIGKSPDGSISLSLDPFTGKDYDGTRVKPLITSAKGNFDFGDVQLESWTGFVHAKMTLLQDTDGFGAAPVAVTRPAPGGIFEPLSGLQVNEFYTTVNQFNQELRLSGESDRLKWSAGGLYWYEKFKQLNNTVAPNFFFNRVPGNIPSAYAAYVALYPFMKPRLEQRITKHTSGYATLSYDVTEDLTVEAEGRYSHEGFDYVIRDQQNLVSIAEFTRNATTGVITRTAPPATQIAGSPIISNSFPAVPAGTIPAALPTMNSAIILNLLPGFLASSSDNFFAPKFTVNYQATDDLLLYATASKGIKPGGFSAVITSIKELARYNPEKLWSYEGGFKGTFADGRVRFNMSGFYMDYSGMQKLVNIPAIPPNVGLQFAAVNIGEARVYGSEIEFTVAPTENFVISGGAAILSPKFTELLIPVTSALGLLTADTCIRSTLGGLPVCLNDQSGNRIEQSAKFSANLVATYTHEINSDWNLVFDLAGSHKGKRFNDEANRFFFDSYIQIDGSIALEGDRYSVTLWGTNLTDDDTIRSAQALGDLNASPGFLALETYPTDPLQLGLRVGVKF